MPHADRKGKVRPQKSFSWPLTIWTQGTILKYMLNYFDIDTSLRALAEPTRRAIVERLSRGPASVRISNHGLQSHRPKQLNKVCGEYGRKRGTDRNYGCCRGFSVRRLSMALAKNIIIACHDDSRHKKRLH
jgi:DNA-binding transcriptional ArsR family regulator